MLLLASALLAVAVIDRSAAVAVAAADDAPEIKSEAFDHDPGWEGFNNHITPRHVPDVTQDFGYDAAGQVGGRVTRAARPAYYADRIEPPLTLDHPLRASGTFAISHTSPGSGVFFGWFNSRQREAGGRPMNSLGMDFDGEHGGARLAVRMIAGDNTACGTFVTPFIPGKYRPTPIRNDGTRYHWTLSYDPQANRGGGQFRFRITSDSKTPETFEGKDFTVDLPAGFRKRGATFDRFGLMNSTKPGGQMTIHFADLRHDGKIDDFTKDPGWIGSGNRATYSEPVQVGVHNFGFSPTTHFAGGAPGEIGGDLWRSGPYGFYADRVGPLTLDDRLEASGKVILLVGAPDSDMELGWFSGDARDTPPAKSGSFLGIHVGGPTRVGHYFQPVFATAKGTTGHAASGPVLVPGRAYPWSLVYDPAANGGNGSIKVTLGEESVTLALKPGVKAQGARLDRFGLCTSNIGGQLVRIYLDDLKYTARH
jgi:hypothetical protein